RRSSDVLLAPAPPARALVPVVLPAVVLASVAAAPPALAVREDQAGQEVRDQRDEPRDDQRGRQRELEVAAQPEADEQPDPQLSHATAPTSRGPSTRCPGRRRRARTAPRRRGPECQSRC